MENKLYPLVFKPVYKDYPWGGNRIPEIYRRNVPPGIYAESWEISDHDDGMSIVSNGPLAGKTFREVLQNQADAILGSNVQGTKFPLLIKLIDARQKLSVQVHPNDETAARFGGEAKTEMWYMLGENDARVWCGLREGVTKERFLEALDHDTSGETLRSVPVAKGDAVFVRGGRVHAIDAGCLILEIQQNSNTTYRIYDWGRMGNDGKPRELHINQAINVMDWCDREDPLVEQSVITSEDDLLHVEVLSCEYFRLEKLVYSEPVICALDETSFHALFIAEGTAIVKWDGNAMEVPEGTSVLVPAILPSYTLGGSATVLRTTVP